MASARGCGRRVAGPSSGAAEQKGGNAWLLPYPRSRDERGCGAIATHRSAEKIEGLLNIQAISTKRVIVGISGMRCFTRPIMLPKLPGEILDEAVRREAERLLPVPLEELYLSWQLIPAPEGNTQVFLTAIPRRIVDPLVSVFHKVGLKP